MEEILVSVDCITYNHEKYIADALESFLMQKTDFKYEILVHDDASTDRTAEIIQKYVLKYPRLIIPKYQTENQYSKGVRVTQININRARGKYIALCEGDDYWTDSNKLQKQVEYMEEHPGCSLCVHAACFVSPDNQKLSLYSRPNKGNKIFKAEEVIEGGGGLFATNSIVCPSKYLNELPDFYCNAPVGDYPLVIYLALKGTVYYIDEFMSAYRANVPGSWSNRNSSANKQQKHYEEIGLMLDEVNRYTDYKYNQTIEKTKIQNYYYLLMNAGLYKQAEKEEMFSALSFKMKFKLFIKRYFPNLAEGLIQIRRKIAG